MRFTKIDLSTASKYFMVFFIGMMLMLPLSLMAQEEAQEQQEEEEEEEDPWADVEFPFEDEKLLAFFDANQEISKLQRETREEMAELTEDHGLSYERFQQIAQAAQIGQLQGGTFSAEEVEAFNEVAPKITQVQRNMQGTVQLIVQEHELDMDDYRNVLEEFRQDEELREYITYLARERAREKILEERRREAERELEEKRQQEQNEQNQ